MYYFAFERHFPDYGSNDEFPLEKGENLRVMRDFYVNPSSQHSSGASLSISVNRFSKGNDEVSSHLHDDFSSSSITLENSDIYSRKVVDDVARHFDSNESHPSLFGLLKQQTITNQHFSTVFKTSKAFEKFSDREKLVENCRYGCHSLKLRKKHRESTSAMFSLEEEFSKFEGKALRNSLNHSLMKARGASSAFVINPVYRPEQTDVEFSCRAAGRLNDFKKFEGATKSKSINLDQYVPCYRNAFEEGKIEENKTQESGYGSDTREFSSDSLENLRQISNETSASAKILRPPDLKANKKPRETLNSCFY